MKVFFERVDNKNVIAKNKEQENQEEVPNKRGRGSERQAKVLVMVESEPSIKAPKKGRPDRKVGCLKMVVMEDLTAESINKEVKKSVEKSASVLTDGYTGYAKLKEKIAHHEYCGRTKQTSIISWLKKSLLELISKE